MNMEVGPGAWNKPKLFDWTEERVAVLRALALDGQSASKIGLTLGTTRNSVIGKCHRIGVQLHSRRVYAEPRHGKPPTDLKRQARNATPGGASNKSGVRIGVTRTPTTTQADNATIANWLHAATHVAVTGLQPSVNPPRLVTMAQLGTASCRFPLGDPCDESFRFCGAVREGSGPYCGPCAKRCYIVPPPAKLRSWRRA